MQPDWYDRAIPGLDPDVVIVFNRSFEAPANPWLAITIESRSTIDDQLRLIQTAVDTTVSRLLTEGRRIIIIEPIPIPAQDPTKCLSGASQIEKGAFLANEAALNERSVYRYLDLSSDDVAAIDIDRLVLR